MSKNPTQSFATTRSSQQMGLPDWLTGQMQNASQMGQNAATYVPFSGATQQGMSQIDRMAGNPSSIPGYNQAFQQYGDTLSGKYLAGGQGFDQALEAAQNRIIPSVTSAFNASGRMGGNAGQSELARQIGDSFSGLYDNERQRQMGALGMAPNMQNLAFDPANRMLMTGAMREAKALERAQDPMRRAQQQVSLLNQIAPHYASRSGTEEKPYFIGGGGVGEALGAGLSLAGMLGLGSGAGGLASGAAGLAGSAGSLLGGGAAKAATGAGLAAGLEPTAAAGAAGQAAAGAGGLPSLPGAGQALQALGSGLGGGALGGTTGGVFGSGGLAGGGTLVPSYLTGGLGFNSVGPTLAGFAGQAGPAGGLAGTAAASGAGGGAAAAPGGLLSGGLGTALGAAAPLALVGFGMMRSKAKHAKQVAAMKPYLDQVKNTPMTAMNIPGQGAVQARPFTDPSTGKQYAITGDPNSGRQGAMGVYDMTTGEHGIWMPGMGFRSIKDMADERDRVMEGEGDPGA